MKRRTMTIDARRCSRCVLPDAPPFSFDEYGTCQLCRTAVAAYASAPRTSLHELETQIRKVKALGKGKPYDCVVGLSGGRDSTYLLYLLVRKHNLRCLAAYYRTPFTPDATDANVRRTVAALRVPLAPIGISSEAHRRFAREMVLLWQRRPSPIIANLMCAPCKLLNREVFRIASANKVSTLIYGMNPHEAVQIAAGIAKDAAIATGVDFSFRRQLARTLALVKDGTVTLARNRSLLKHVRLGVQASLMYLTPHTPYLRLRYPRVHAMEYFYYYPWSEQECTAVLAELGWVLPPGCNSGWKSDCSFAEVKNHVFRKTTGVTYVDGLLSNMVRAGVLSRDEALQRLEVEGKPSTERLAEACRELALPATYFA